MQPILRFAPSPNGLLHLGHAFSALTNEACARRLGARLLLRIEDIDPQRSRQAYVDALLEDLAWLGIRFDGPVLRQSAHMADYAQVLDRLHAEGLVYRCFCSRGDTSRFVAAAEASGNAWPRDPDGTPHHAGPCAALSAAEAGARAQRGDLHVWRLRMQDAVVRIGGAPLARSFDPASLAVAAWRTDPGAWGDVVVARRDVPTSYHLAVVVDDARQAISHVVRGADLQRATDVHRVLQELLGMHAPLYHHHRLLLDEDGRKLAKSRLSAPLRSLREGGLSASALRAELGFAPAAQ